MTIRKNVYQSARQPGNINKTLDQDVILKMLDQGEVRKAIDVLGLSHNRMGTILRFRLDKIDQDEREAAISHNWAERGRQEITTELREQLRLK